MNTTPKNDALTRREATVDFDHAFGELSCTLVEIMNNGHIGGLEAGRLFDLLEEIEAAFNTIRAEADPEVEIW